MLCAAARPNVKDKKPKPAHWEIRKTEGGGGKSLHRNTTTRKIN